MVYQDKERQLKGVAEANPHCLCVMKRERKSLRLRKPKLRHFERSLRTTFGLSRDRLALLVVL